MTKVEKYPTVPAIRTMGKSFSCMIALIALIPVALMRFMSIIMFQHR